MKWPLFITSLAHDAIPVTILLVILMVELGVSAAVTLSVLKGTFPNLM